MPPSLAGVIPSEVLPPDVQDALSALAGTDMQVEVYPGHELVVIRYRQRLSIVTDILVLPFSIIDTVYLSRLGVQVSKAVGGAVVPANGPSPASNPGNGLPS